MTSVESCWRDFLATQPQGSPAHAAKPQASKWGDSDQMADELGALIASGVKTATCAAVAEYEALGEQAPRPGDFTVVLDGRGEPLAIIETLETMVRHFADVDAGFASDEGEGDRSLEHWRAVHRAYFTRSLGKLGQAFTEDTPLVCERFRLVHVARRGPA